MRTPKSSRTFCTCKNSGNTESILINGTIPTPVAIITMFLAAPDRAPPCAPSPSTKLPKGPSKSTVVPSAKPAKKVEAIPPGMIFMQRENPSFLLGEETIE
ncbi:MAG: hypothetical protein WC846_01585 [Candidatus Gracilibacteria bacterium]